MKIKNIFKNKITYFDIILGVIFVIVTLGIFLFLYRKNEYVNIRVKITDQDVLYANTNPQSWYANRFDIGDTEKDELGRVTAEIIGVQTFDTTESTKAVYLDIKIKAVYDRRTQTYSAKGTTLVFGSTIRFYFSKVSFNALITESPGTLNQKGLIIEDRIITVLERGPSLIEPIEPKVLEKIRKGDTVMDSNGNVLARVANITLRSGQRVTQNDSGSLLLRQDPYYKDAIITLVVSTKKYKGESFVFDNVPLKLGVTLPLNFSYESIYPVIISI